MKITVYRAYHNPCVHESGRCVISLHQTRQGAEKAVSKHKEEARAKWESLFKTDEDREFCPFGEFEEWGVDEFDLLD